ncbi:MAG: ATP-binding protein [Actinomycetota bacterium]|nr:ATP-binding protein [Actinomycetota bacterium]
MTDITSPSHRHTSAARGEQVKVLLVEDSCDYAELVCDMLEESAPELSVTTRSGIADAQAALSGEKFDCVIMDLGLPDARGLTGMRRLVACAPENPVVVLTGRDDDAIGLEAVKEGAQDYLVKARTDGDLLARAISYAIERKSVALELARHADQVQAFAERQRDFVASASHELRTPLTSIMGYLELVLDDPDADPQESRGHVEVAYRNSQRLLALVEDLLTVNGLDTGNLPLTPAAVDGREILAPAADLAQGLCALAGVSFEYEPLAAGVIVQADAARTTKVLENLLGNAVKFTPPDGSVHLRAQARDGRLEIEVGDTGIGIPANDIPHIFERFFRSPDAVRKAVPGTGLGLSIAKSLIEAQSGGITVASRPGEGTTFTVSLPLTLEQSWPGSS